MTADYTAIRELASELEEAAAAWGQDDGAGRPSAAALESTRMARRALLRRVGLALGIEDSGVATRSTTDDPGAGSLDAAVDTERGRN